MEIEKIEEMIEEESKRIYTELKDKSKTYSELEIAINASLRKEKWSGSRAGKVILEKVMKMYEEDITRIKTLPIKGAKIKDC